MATSSAISASTARAAGLPVDAGTPGQTCSTVSDRAQSRRAVGAVGADYTRTPGTAGTAGPGISEEEPAVAAIATGSASFPGLADTTIAAITADAHQPATGTTDTAITTEHALGESTAGTPIAEHPGRRTRAAIQTGAAITEQPTTGGGLHQDAVIEIRVRTVTHQPARVGEGEQRIHQIEQPGGDHDFAKLMDGGIDHVVDGVGQKHIQRGQRIGAGRTGHVQIQSRHWSEDPVQQSVQIKFGLRHRHRRQRR